MTDKARELLERALGSLDAFYGVGGSFLGEEIRTYLADTNPSETINSQEVDRSEPVAYRHLHEDGWEYYDAPTGEDCDGCHALFDHPAPQRSFVRLSEKEISETAQKCFIRREAGQYHIPYGTTDFARAIEDALEAKNK